MTILDLEKLAAIDAAEVRDRAPYPWMHAEKLITDEGYQKLLDTMPDKSQFKRIYGDAARTKGDTGENLIGLLERRLDAVVYRAKFVPTVFAARQFVNHGHVLVNGKRVNIPSYRVKEGDVIEVRDKSKQMALVLEASQLPERDVPDYLDVDHSKMTATFVRTPGLSDVPYPVMMEPNLVIEYYAQN